MTAMDRSEDEKILPRGALIGAGALVLATLLLATTARLTGYQPDRPAPSAVVQSVALVFEDRADGGISIIDQGSGRLVDTLPPGSNGFVRGVLRGLARERRADHVGAEQPFRLTRWADGRLSLDDPATGRHIDLEVFGMTNAGAFAEILMAANRT